MPATTSTDCDRSRNLLFFATPSLWVYWPYLPLVRRSPGKGEECGLLCDVMGLTGTPGLERHGLRVQPLPGAGRAGRPHRPAEGGLRLARGGLLGRLARGLIRRPARHRRIPRTFPRERIFVTRSEELRLDRHQLLGGQGQPVHVGLRRRAVRPSRVRRARLVVAHADLGRVEWPGTRELAEEQALHYGLEFIAVSRPQGDLWSTPRHGGMFPSPSAMWCTSDHLCGLPHNMSYVASPVMWRSPCSLRETAVMAKLDAT